MNRNSTSDSVLFVSCQTNGAKSSKIQWQASLGSTGTGVPIPFGDHIDWSAFDGLLKINPTVEIKDTGDTPGRKAANVELPGSTKTLSTNPATQPKVSNTPTLPPPTTTRTTQQTPTVPVRTLPPTQPPTPPPTPPPTQPPTQPPTPPPTMEATPAPPVIMVQHSLSGISGPSNIISQAQEWIDGSRCFAD
ncbi:uncharacterized protein LOC134717868 [Mytilus trossulus]|uniref:uncharacterized protein LOC134717868 n=1 Tax=Mytilus trossulus TaxID=6551 RepID=UPI0030077195